MHGDLLCEKEIEMLTVELLTKIFKIFYNVNFDEFVNNMFSDYHEGYQLQMFESFSSNPTAFINRLDSGNLQELVEWINRS